MTARQSQVLAYIAKHLSSEHRAPTVREIGEGMGIASPNGVQRHLVALEQQGLIKRGRGSRSIRLVNFDVCPCCGKRKESP